MTTYHVHARLLRGPLSAPLCNEVRVAETESLSAAEDWCRAHVADGFTVWIFDHGHTDVLVGASNLRRIGYDRPVL